MCSISKKLSMSNHLLKSLFYCASICVFITSCIKDVDFQQAQNVAISPIFDVSLIYFQEPASSFVNDGVEMQVTQDTLRIDIFSDQFIVDNLIKAEFLFEGVNTINRAYEAKIDFLDDNDALQHTFTLSIPASPNNIEIITEEIEIFEDNTLDALKMTTRLVFTLTLFDSDDGSILTENSPGLLRFRSKGTFYFNIDIL